MPAHAKNKPSRPVIHLLGSDEYAAALGALADAVRATGADIRDANHLSHYALAILAAQYGIPLPPRTRPVGTNRHGEPRASGITGR